MPLRMAPTLRPTFTLRMETKSRPAVSRTELPMGHGGAPAHREAGAGSAGAGAGSSATAPTNTLEAKADGADDAASGPTEPKGDQLGSYGLEAWRARVQAKRRKGQAEDRARHQAGK